MLVAQDYKGDMDALDPKAKRDADDDDTDDLVGAFSQLGVTRKCRVCTTEYVVRLFAQHSMYI